MFIILLLKLFSINLLKIIEGFLLAIIYHVQELLQNLKSCQMLFFQVGFLASLLYFLLCFWGFPLYMDC